MLIPLLRMLPFCILYAASGSRIYHIYFSYSASITNAGHEHGVGAGSPAAFLMAPRDVVKVH